MGVIRSGIWTKFLADNTAALYTDLSGTRLYYAEAEERPTVPYCVFNVFTEVYDFMFVEEFEEALIQFDYYGSTADECDDGVTDIKTMFDYTTLTISGYTCLKMERDMVFDSVKVEPDNIWVGTVRYNLLMKKN